MGLADKVAALTIDKDKLYARPAIKLTDAELVEAIEKKLVCHRNQFGVEEFWLNSIPHMNATKFSRPRKKLVGLPVPVAVVEVAVAPKAKKASPAKKQSQPVAEGVGLFG